MKIPRITGRENQILRMQVTKSNMEKSHGILSEKHIAKRSTTFTTLTILIRMPRIHFTERRRPNGHPSTVGSLPSPRPFPRRKWNRVVEHVIISPPRGVSTEVARSRVPPTVAPQSMTAQVGLVVVAANGRESVGHTAASRRAERYSYAVSVRCTLAVPCPRTSIRPARLRRRRAVPPLPRYRHLIGRSVLLALGHVSLPQARWHTAARKSRRSTTRRTLGPPTAEAPCPTEQTRQQ